MQLRDDLKTGQLSLSIFAADLYDVVMQKGQRPVYEKPSEFFALTYPTYNLRELVRDVCLRLDGKSDKAYRKLSVNYGGGKTHTLITLRHLAHDPDGLPDLPAVREFEAHIDFRPPRPASPRCASTRSTWKKASRPPVLTERSRCSRIHGAYWPSSLPVRTV